MRIIHQSSELSSLSRKLSLAVGVFDGVHLGHQQVIRQALADARQCEGLSVAVTFDRHPNTVVAPERTPPLVYPLPKKLDLLDQIGLDVTLLIRFDAAFSQIPAEDFIRSLTARPAQIQSICVGNRFTFGHRRGGTVETLRHLGQLCHFRVHALASVALDGQPVSSTRIRDCIRAGDLDSATELLGRDYSLCGRVVRGEQLGRRLGFPTANLDVAGLVLPPAGVYAAHARLGQSLHRAVVNVGHRPTVASNLPDLRVEAHLLDFHGDLYDAPMELLFVKRLRDESKFPSLAALTAQIKTDIVTARSLFSS